jgi:hypothetical protein
MGGVGRPNGADPEAKSMTNYKNQITCVIKGLPQRTRQSSESARLARLSAQANIRRIAICAIIIAVA